MSNFTVKIILFMKKYFIILFFIPYALLAQITYKPNEKQENTKLYLQKYIDSLAQLPMLKNAHLGVSIKKCNTNENIVAKNDQLLMKPASTLKLITTGMALLQLGANKTFFTTLKLFGTQNNSQFNGNLVIEPSGDPSFGSWRYENKPEYNTILTNWVQAIKKQGIKHINGKIIFNTKTHYPPVSWPWGDIGNYYGAHFQSFMFFENMIQVYYNTASDSTLALIDHTDPAANIFNIKSEVLASSKTKSDNSLGFNSPGFDQIIINGTLPINKTNFKVKLSNPNPQNHFAQLLKAEITKQGIVLVDSLIKIENESSLVLNQKHESPTLLELAQQTNFQSINIYAEALHVAYNQDLAQNNKPQNGVLWQSLGLDSLQIQQKDGSGLSPSNYVSPGFMTDYLNKMQSNTTTFNSFVTSIPKVGIEGTVKNLVPKKSKAIGKVWAKSGTIEKVRCYAGYYQSKAGQWYSFAFMANQFNCSQSQINGVWSRMIDQLTTLE